MNLNVWLFIFAAIQALGVLLAFFRVDIRLFSRSSPDIPVKSTREKIMASLALGSLVLCGFGLYRLTGADLPDAGHTGTSAPQPSFDARIVLPDGRTIISSSPKDLQEAFRNSTAAHFNRLLGEKWIKISGNISEVFGSGNVMIETQDSPRIFLHFVKGWEEQLSALPRGSSVTIRGKMSSDNNTWITLEECEVL